MTETRTKYAVGVAVRSTAWCDHGGMGTRNYSGCGSATVTRQVAGQMGHFGFFRDHKRVRNDTP